MEHLEEPEKALRECARVLKPGGFAIYGVPFIWHLHEEPRDFYRYTEHGLDQLFTKAGFVTLEINQLAGFVVTFGQELVYFLNRLRRGPTTYPVAAVQWAIQVVAYLLNRWDRSYAFTWADLVVA